MTTAFAPIIDYVPFTPLQNATGQPAISLPLHWTRRRPAGRRACSAPSSATRRRCSASPVSSSRRGRGRIAGRRSGTEAGVG